jgi:hypothetical protein
MSEMMVVPPTPLAEGGLVASWLRLIVSQTSECPIAFPLLAIVAMSLVWRYRAQR